MATVAISRARSGSMVATCWAAMRSIWWAIWTEPVFHSMRARRLVRSARIRSSTTSRSAARARLSLRAGCPLSQALSAAPNKRRARGSTAAVSSAARSQAADAASCPPRRRARSATWSRPWATSASGPLAEPAKCHIRRSKSAGSDRAWARARCTRRRSVLVADPWIADRTSGCWSFDVLIADREQVRGLQGLHVRMSGAKACCGAQNHVEAAGVLGGGNQQEGLDPRGQLPVSLEVDPFDASRQRGSRGSAVCPASCSGSSAAGISTSARGFPPVRSRNRSATSRGTVRPAFALSRSRAASRPSP